MYAVVSGHKPPRPWLAIGISAGLMVASAMAAWALVRARNRPVETALTDRFAPTGWPLALHLPGGWIEDTGPPSAGLSWLTFADGHPSEARRWLHVSRYHWGHYVPPAMGALQMAGRTVPTRAAALGLQAANVEPVAFGAFPGAAFVIQAQGGGTRRYACAVGSSPTGEKFALVLWSVWDRIDDDLALVKHLAEAMEVTEPALRNTLDFTGKSLRFEPPGGARFHEPPIREVERIGCLSPEGADPAWHVTVSRTWLTGDRTAKQLLQSRVADAAATEEATIETVARRPGPAFRAVLGGEGDGPDRLIEELWCIPLGNGAAARIEGRTDGRGQEALADACRQIAETVRLGPVASAIETAPAVARGESVIQEIKESGLGTSWGNAPSVDWYEITKLGIPAGFYRSARAPATRDERNGYNLTDSQYYQPLVFGPIVYLSHWFVASDLTTDHGERIMETGPGRTTRRYHSRESVRVGDQSRQRWRSLDGRIVRDSVALDGTYLCDATLNVAQYLVARSPDQGPAIFTQGALFDPPGQAGTIWCKPLGRRTIQRADGPLDAWDLLVIRDHDSAYRILRFDENGRLVRESIEGEIEITLTTQDRIESRFSRVSSILKDLEDRLLNDR